MNGFIRTGRNKSGHIKTWWSKRGDIRTGRKENGENNGKRKEVTYDAESLEEAREEDEMNKGMKKRLLETGRWIESREWS